MGITQGEVPGEGSKREAETHQGRRVRDRKVVGRGDAAREHGEAEVSGASIR